MDPTKPILSTPSLTQTSKASTTVVSTATSGSNPSKKSPSKTNTPNSNTNAISTKYLLPNSVLIPTSLRSLQKARSKTQIMLIPQTIRLPAPNQNLRLRTSK